MIVNDCVRRRNYTKKTASGIIPDAVFYGIYAGKSENHLAYVVALTTDVEAAGGILYAYALEVEVLYRSVFVGNGYVFDTGGAEYVVEEYHLSILYHFPK